jgi:type I restriction-modification system DNA methylase subunit
MGKAITKNHRAGLVRLIRKLAPKYGLRSVFGDFLALSALSVSNSVDREQRNEREEEYLSIIGKYEKAEVELFPEMFANLVLELEEYAEQPRDVLGEVYQELELQRGSRGQVFTPQNVCDMMGTVSLGEYNCEIEENGYVSVCEPCCGAGAMVLGFAAAMLETGYSINENMVVSAVDLDIACIYMCYIQLSLYGIPAVVVHGDSLTNEVWSRWQTPQYVFGGWAWRLSNEAAERIRNVPAYAAATPGIDYDVTLRESENGQITFNFGGQNEAVKNK